MKQKRRTDQREGGRCDGVDGELIRVWVWDWETAVYSKIKDTHTRVAHILYIITYH